MSWHLELIDSVSFFLFTCILYFLSILSKRLGEVLGLEKYYYFYYMGMIFTFLGSVMMTLSVVNSETQELFGYVLFSIGLTFGVIATIKYWGWLIKELIRE